MNRPLSIFFICAALVASSNSARAQPTPSQPGLTKVFHGNSLTGNGTTTVELDARVAPGGGLDAGIAASGITLLRTCAISQLLVWNGSSWGCSDPAGDITAVVAGNGLTGGGTSGAVTLDVGSGNGITVGADAISVNNGTGLIFSTGALTYDSAVIQTRVGSTCTAPNSITAISSTGTVTCTTITATTTDVNTAVNGTATKVGVFSGTHVIGNGWASDDGTSWGVSGKFLITEATGNTAINGSITGDGGNRVIDTTASSARIVQTANSIDLATVGGGAGSCTNCSVTFDVYGRETAYSSGTAPATGTGSTNTTTKWTGTSTIGNAWPTDDGTTWGVTSKFTITEASGNLRTFGTATVDGAFVGSSTGSFSGALNMNSNKITSLTNGSSAQDAVAFNQLATAINAAVTGTTNRTTKFTGTNAVGNGWASDDGTIWGTSSIFTITEASGNFRTFGTGTIDGAALLSSTLHAVGAVTFDGNTTLGDTSGDTITFTAVAATTLDMNSHKVLNVTNGASAQDVVAFNQLATAVNAAVSGTTNTMAKFSGTNAVGNSLWTDDGTTTKYNTTKFTLASSSGNATFAGTLDVTGAATADSGARIITAAGTGLSKSTNSLSVNIAGASCSAGSFISALGATGTGTCTAASGLISGLSNGTLPIATSGTTIADSTITKSGSAYTLTGSITATSLITGNAGAHLDTSTSDGAGPELDWIGRNGNWMLGVDIANVTPSRDFVLAAIRKGYSCEDAATTNGSATLTSAAECGFTSAQVGKTITGTGIPGGTTISAVGGPTSITLSANATVTASGVRVTVTNTNTDDIIYLKHRGGLSPTIGLGVTPPSGSYRVQVSPDDNEVAMGGLGIRIGPSQTGKAFAVYDSGGTSRFWMTADGFLSGTHAATGRAIAIKDNGSGPLLFYNSGGTVAYDWYYSGNSLIQRYASSAVDATRIDTDGSFNILQNATVAGTLAVSNDTTITSVAGASLSTGSVNLSITDTTAAAAGVGGAINFRGAYTGSTLTDGAVIRMAKSNAGAGDYSFDLLFATRTSGNGDVTQALKLSGVDQLATFGPGTDAPTVTNARAIFENNGTTCVATRDATNNVEMYNCSSSSGGFVGTSTNNLLALQTNSTTAIQIDTSQNSWIKGSANHVGAGGDSPTTGNAVAWFTNAGATAIVVRDSSNDSEWQVTASNLATVMGTVTNHALNIKTNNTNAITIDTSQNVGVVGHINDSGTVPSLAAGAGCGVSPTINANSNDNGGLVTVGTSISACVITFAHAYTNTPSCDITGNDTTVGAGTYYISAISNSSFTVKASGTLSGSKFMYMCIGLGS